MRIFLRLRFNLRVRFFFHNFLRKDTMRAKWKKKRTRRLKRKRRKMRMRSK
jgi:hypothetical protein